MPKHHPSSTELQLALNRFFSFSKDLNIIFSHFSHNSLPSPYKKPSRKKPTHRSTAWKNQQLPATTAAAVPSTPVSLPPGRRDVLKTLILQSRGQESSDDSESSSTLPGQVLLVGEIAEEREGQSERSGKEEDTDPDYLPSDDTFDGSSSRDSSDSYDEYTSNSSSEGDYDSDQPYGPASDDLDNHTTDRSFDSDNEHSDIPHITDRHCKTPSEASSVKEDPGYPASEHSRENSIDDSTRAASSTPDRTSESDRSDQPCSSVSSRSSFHNSWNENESDRPFNNLVNEDSGNHLSCHPVDYSRSETCESELDGYLSDDSGSNSDKSFLDRDMPDFNQPSASLDAGDDPIPMSPSNSESPFDHNDSSYCSESASDCNDTYNQNNPETIYGSHIDQYSDECHVDKNEDECSDEGYISDYD